MSFVIWKFTENDLLNEATPLVPISFVLGPGSFDIMLNNKNNRKIALIKKHCMQRAYDRNHKK